MSLYPFIFLVRLWQQHTLLHLLLLLLLLLLLRLLRLLLLAANFPRSKSTTTKSTRMCTCDVGACTYASRRFQASSLYVRERRYTFVSFIYTFLSFSRSLLSAFLSSRSSSCLLSFFFTRSLLSRIRPYVSLFLADEKDTYTFLSRLLVVADPRRTNCGQFSSNQTGPLRRRRQPRSTRTSLGTSRKSRKTFLNSYKFIKFIISFLENFKSFYFYSTEKKLIYYLEKPQFSKDER